MNYGDPYSAYIEGSVLSIDPVRLVIKLYEGAIESVEKARHCLHTGDIRGRGQAVNKVVNILGELLGSLDHERGGTISSNLQSLYLYMQVRVSEAHVQKSEAPLNEVHALLKNLLEGWYAVAEKGSQESSMEIPALHNAAKEHIEERPYGGYYYEPVESFAGTAATF